jgi:anti-sigma factor RsiW
MLIPNHPDDERLSALASGDPEAVADAVLSEHVASCIRCTDTVAELGALRASLAELPDVRPHRPLQLLPPVADTPARADRVGGWARRFFAPILTAGAALALVGVVGTTAPLLGGASSGAAPEALGQIHADGTTTRDQANPAEGGAAASEGTELNYGLGATPSAQEVGPAVVPVQSDIEEPAAFDNGVEAQSLDLDARSIFPMLLFAGIAIMIAAAVLRWILAPRAG